MTLVLLGFLAAWLLCHGTRKAVDRALAEAKRMLADVAEREADVARREASARIHAATIAGYEDVVTRRALTVAAAEDEASARVSRLEALAKRIQAGHPDPILVDENSIEAVGMARALAHDAIPREEMQ